MTPPPDVLVCTECGYAEFSIPHAWLAAGWLKEGAGEKAKKSEPLSPVYAITAMY